MTGPQSLVTLDDWLGWLPALSAREIDLGLERVAEVYARLALPRPGRVFTIAGTNGKGSTVLMLQALLLARGASVGAYTSPHILRYEERIRVNGAMADAATIVEAFKSVEAVRGDIPLTYFEFGTLAALCVFAQHDVEFALLEVGLGGRLDAVNVVEHDGCIITNVSMDHSEWLGDSIGQIAQEKSGVMRSARPAIFGSAEMPAEVREVADKMGADLRVAGRDFRWRDDGETGWSWQGRGLQFAGLHPLAMEGAHQRDNAAAALALLEAAGLGEQIAADTVNHVLAGLVVPGRQQQLCRRDRHWLLDGAHNEEGARVLGERLAALEDGRRVVLVLGILNDKDIGSIAAQLLPSVSEIVTLTPDTPRALDAVALKTMIEADWNVPVQAAESPQAALEFAHNRSAPADLIVVAGSFYTLAMAYRWLGDTIG